MAQRITPRRRGKGEGSITKRADGRFVASVDFGYMNGKRVRPQKTCKTKTEAIAAIRKMQASQDRGIIPDAVTLEAWLAYWLDSNRELRPRTRKTYQGFIDGWLIPLAGDVQIRKLAPEHVRAIHRKMRAEGKSAATIRHVHVILRSALAMAVEEERVHRNVAAIVKAPTADADSHHAVLSAADARRILDAASGVEYVRIMVAMLGLRQGEALGLRWRDVIERDDGMMLLNVAGQIQWIDGKRVRTPTKSKASVRQVAVPFPERLRGLRDMVGGEPDAYVFGEISPFTDARRWKALLERAGVEHVPLHGARGTGATLLLEMGVPLRYISDILGHANIKVTANAYTRSDEDRRAAAMELLGRRLGMDSPGP